MRSSDTLTLSAGMEMARGNPRRLQTWVGEGGPFRWWLVDALRNSGIMVDKDERL